MKSIRYTYLYIQDACNIQKNIYKAITGLLSILILKTFNYLGFIAKHTTMTRKTLLKVVKIDKEGLKIDQLRIRNKPPNQINVIYN